uniref:Reverse transcriptase domain-containing protein n=1 Tax=Tanacetum cinerariifolium TaxID=118510 RepID=A0A699IDV3_TANCI|nr:reverse transcriptase domain-containing protein [Tanacetum cinerariifolium]GEZ51154.1 reverse transcriptase domain-containing protein [Tanacetum cinerariifolium]
MWKLYTDGALSFDGSGAGLMLLSPEGKEYTYALRFKFETTNNEAKYEALLAGLRIAEEMEIKNLVIDIVSQLVVNQNKKADTLSKLDFMTFEHLTKKVLVEVLANMSINNKELEEETMAWAQDQKMEGLFEKKVHEHGSSWELDDEEMVAS